MKCKFDFKGLDTLEKNYSDLWQDMFVLAVLQCDNETMINYDDYMIA